MYFVFIFSRLCFVICEIAIRTKCCFWKITDVIMIMMIMTNVML